MWNTSITDHEYLTTWLSSPPRSYLFLWVENNRGLLKYDGTRAETSFRLSAKRTSPFKSAEASVQSISGSRGVRISGSNAGYTMFRGSVKGTGYPLHSPVSPSPPPRTSPCAITFQLESAFKLVHDSSLPRSIPFVFIRSFDAVLPKRSMNIVNI